MSDAMTISRSWRSAGAIRSKSTASVAEETIGSSQWVLELQPYVHHASLIAALDELATHTNGANPFFESEFIAASVDRIGEPVKNLLVLWERIGETEIARMAFPVVDTRIGLPPRHVLRAWSHPYAPLSTPLIDKRDAEETCLRFASLYGRLEPARHLPLVFADFATEDPAAMALGKALADAGFATISTAYGSRSCLPPLGGRPVNAHLPILASSKRRRELKRQLKKLGALGKVEFEKVDEFEHMLVRFEEFLLLETRGWKGRKGTSIHILRKTASFARQAVAALGDRGRAAIYSLRLDGRAIASLIVLRSGNRYFPWKIAFDAAYHAYSPGVHLILEASEDMLQLDGFAGADSLATELSWIDRLWPARMQLETLIIAPPDTPAAGRVPAVAQAVERELEVRRLARRLLRRNPPSPSAASAKPSAPRQSPAPETAGE
jgi:hypothetical protein